jgi:hypothetical protein
VNAKSASRRDRRWQARYAKSQRSFERTLSRIPDELRVPRPSGVITVSVEGENYMLRLFSPGEPIKHENLWAGFYLVCGLFLRGQHLVHRRGDDTWVVRLQRQRGAWRGFETVWLSSFVDYHEAITTFNKVGLSLEAGRVPVDASL